MNPTIAQYVAETVQGIINKIIGKRPLSEEELNFLASYDLPALRLLNVLAPYPSALRAIQLPLTQYISYELLYQFVLTLNKGYSRIFYKLRNMQNLPPDMDLTAQECVKDLLLYRKNPVVLLDRLRREVQNRKSQVLNKIRFALDIYELERKFLARFADSPGLRGYMMGRVLK